MCEVGERVDVGGIRLCGEGEGEMTMQTYG